MVLDTVLQEILTGLFPNGISRYLLGGVLIGLGVGFIYLATGLIPGASTVLESTWTYVSGLERFRDSSLVGTRDWRIIFTLGIIAGGAVYAFAFQGGIWTTSVQWWRLLAGGVLVGIGTRLGKGCTSGHGVCGLGSASSTSLVNVVTFLAIAIGTAQLVNALGVTP